MRLLFIFLCAIGAAIGAYFGQPLVGGNSEAITIIITVLSVFAGFLVAIVTILGDPAMIPGGTWRKAEVRRDGVEASLIRHSWLFVVYLLAIGFLFSGVLLSTAPVSDCVKLWFERFYLFLGIFAFFLTFALPSMLYKVQMGRLDAEIERRRQKAGIKDDDQSIS
ncbi:putative membrane protein [Labrenzia sp. EL_159]|nr:putative membrane protein [Labrenzia sp. EL_162]MBG6196754.1 putative membrane protein [Labrenzia sp. EL_159]